MPLEFEFGKKSDQWAGRHHHAEWKLEEEEARHDRVEQALQALEEAYLRGEMDPMTYQDKREKLLEQLE